MLITSSTWWVAGPASSGFRAFEDPVHVCRGPSEQIEKVRSIGHQAATSRLIEDLAHGGQQFPHADRLALESVKSGGHDSCSVLSHYRRGDGNDRGATRQWIRPQP